MRTSKRFRLLLDHADSVQLIEKGPVRATIRVTRTWQSSKFVQDITLYAGLESRGCGQRYRLA